MRTGKKLAVILVSLCLVFSLAGCSADSDSWKDNILKGFNDALHHFSKHALTDDKDLQGDRTYGDDTYTGSYSSEYDNFNDKEYIFGGTGLSREQGNELAVTYELQITSGKAKLYWRNKDKESMIAEETGSDTYSVTLNSGDDYLVLEGDHFTGSLQVNVE